MNAVWLTRQSARRSLLSAVARRWLRSTVVPCLLSVVSATAISAQTTRVSVATGGAQGTGASTVAAVSSDGRYVAFGSAAPNLVAGDTNGQNDVFVHDRLTGVTTRESVATGGAQATGHNGRPALSADARFLAFHSAAANLVAGDTNGLYDVFVRDRVLGTTTRVNVANGGIQATGGDTFNPTVSADGRYVAFESTASNLVAGDTNGVADVFLHDRMTATTTRVSVASGGGQATFGSSEAALSADGRYVSFTSFASNLVVGDTNNTNDIFMHDQTTGVTTRVSVATGGGQASFESIESSLSSDGRYVAFSSSDPNLVTGDTNDVADVFVHDRTTQTTTRISVATNGGQTTNQDSGLPTVSADGRYVAFLSVAANLVTGDTNDRTDVFKHDRVTGVTTRVNIASGGDQATGGDGYGPAMSADGRYVAFFSDAPNLAPGDTNAAFDVFVHDTRLFQRRRLSVTTSGEQANGASHYPDVSADGRYVTFVSDAPNLVVGDTNNRADIFVHDRMTGATTRESVATDGAQATDDSHRSSLSRDGRYVAFNSDATNLVPGDTNDFTDVFVRDRESGTTTRVSVATGGAQASGYSYEPVLSGDGRYVAFASKAPNLVAGDTNGKEDIFVHDRVTGETTRVSVTTNGNQAMEDSFVTAISGDGRYVVFESKAPNLVTGDTNGKQDIFLHDRVTKTTTRVSVATGGSQATADSYLPTISGDGRYIAFTSDASNLVAGGSNPGSDVFVHDRVTGATTHVSVMTGGGLASGGDSYESALSEDGRYVAFYSSAPNLVMGDTNRYADIFVHDRATGETVRASLGPGESQGNSSHGSPSLSADGRVLVYQSGSTNLVTGDTNNASDIFVRAATPVLSGLTPRSGSTIGGTTVEIHGVGFQLGTTVSVGGAPAPHVDVISSSKLTLTTPPHAAGVTDIAVTVPGYDAEHLVFSYTYLTPPPASSTTDTDGDGLPDAYELQYGLDPLDTNDASQDADGDGVSNAAEYAAGTHPTGFVTRYLAEGATSSFFRTTLALVNPGEADANVLLRFLPSAGNPISHSLLVPAHSRHTVDVEDVPGLVNAEFSTVLESDHLVVLDRTMQWDVTGYGSHSETALPARSTTWYLAEGATHSGFDLFYLLQNTASTETAVQVTFLRPAPLAPLVKSYTLAPQSRFNIWVDEADPALANTDVSAQILASQPIVVERAMYLSKGGQQFTAGHQSAGVTAPALSWFLAEGATGSFFDLFVLLSNPNTSPANVSVTFLKPDGSTLVKTYTVAAQSRFNIWVDLEDPELANTAVSTTVQVTNNVPIIVERAMWWPGDSSMWNEAHNSPGATATGTAWVVASGEDGGSSNAETYVLIANTALIAATVDVTLLLDDGRTVTRQYGVPAQSRWNVAMREDFADAVGKRFGVMVESVGPNPAPVVVESAVYSNAGGAVWAAGANTLATKLRD